MKTTYTQPQIQTKLYLYPLLTSEEKLKIWKKVKSMWKNRKPNPITELKTIRKEWER